GALFLPASNVTVFAAWLRCQKMRCAGLLCSRSAQRAPCCSRYAPTRRTPCGLAIRTVTGVVTPTTLTGGSMLRTEREDRKNSTTVPPAAKRKMAMSAFTFGLLLDSCFLGFHFLTSSFCLVGGICG